MFVNIDVDVKAPSIADGNGNRTRFKFIDVWKSFGRPVATRRDGLGGIPCTRSDTCQPLRDRAVAWCGRHGTGVEGERPGAGLGGGG